MTPPSQKQRPADRSRPNPRHTALELLQEVLRQRRPLDEALARKTELARYSSRDRAFVRHLVASCLRRLGQLDAAIAACLERPLPAKLADAQDILRLGAVQLLFLETPPHAAVSTTVDLAGRLRLDHVRKLINAVMRRLDREGAALLAKQDAVRLNTPDWLWQAWCSAYGEALTRQIAEAHLGEPPLDLSAKRDPETWARRLEAELLPTGSLRLAAGQGDVRRLAGFEAGAWWVQDAAAALPARLLGPVEGQTIIDLCAAPGGKSAQLAAAGAQVTTVERSPQRNARLLENLARLNLTVESIVADATSWQPPRPADGVLLDAPCSATGTLRRHPDIAHIKEGQRFGSLLQLQDSLLTSAAKMVRPGGRLVYAVCSLQEEEGPARVAKFLQAHRGQFDREPVSLTAVGRLSQLITPEGDLRVLPCHLIEQGGMDGFYACCLKRRDA